MQCATLRLRVYVRDLPIQPMQSLFASAISTTKRFGFDAVICSASVLLLVELEIFPCTSYSSFCTNTNSKCYGNVVVLLKSHVIMRFY